LGGNYRGPLAQLGFNSVIFLAGLQNIPEEYYEAAELDGANAWQKFVPYHPAGQFHRLLSLVL